MDQVTLRLDDALARELRAEARRRGMSLNAFASAALGAAVDPDNAEDEVQRLRERLRRAGLLADVTPVEQQVTHDELDAARSKLAARPGEYSGAVTADRG